MPLLIALGGLIGAGLLIFVLIELWAIALPKLRVDPGAGSQARRAALSAWRDWNVQDRPAVGWVGFSAVDRRDLETGAVTA